MRKRWRVQRKRVRGLADKWVRRLGLGWWVRVGFKYHYRKEECKKVFAVGQGRRALMSINADWRYLEAVVLVNLRFVEKVSDGRLEFYFVHEMIHALLDEAQIVDRDHEERVATWLALAFIWTDQGKR